MVATKVNACSVSSCAYNESNACHALAITVGEPSPTTCATFTPKLDGKQAGSRMTIADVGACKAASCTHNKNLTCTAAEISVGMSAGSVTCLTYEKA